MALEEFFSITIFLMRELFVSIQIHVLTNFIMLCNYCAMWINRFFSCLIKSFIIGISNIYSWIHINFISFPLRTIEWSPQVWSYFTFFFIFSFLFSFFRFFVIARIKWTARNCDKLLKLDYWITQTVHIIPRSFRSGESIRARTLVQSRRENTRRNKPLYTHVAPWKIVFYINVC